MARHVHADLMIAKANDASLKIEIMAGGDQRWIYCHAPSWNPLMEYRIKPKPPAVVEFYGIATIAGNGQRAYVSDLRCNIEALISDNVKLTFTDGKLTGAEVLK